jgi:high-affinity iron transporter
MAKMRRLPSSLILICLLGLLLALPAPAFAQAAAPPATPTLPAAAEALRAALVQVQMQQPYDLPAAQAALAAARQSYDTTFAAAFAATAPQAAQRIEAGFAEAERALNSSAAPALAAARAAIWTGLLDAAHQSLLAALAAGDAAAAQSWLQVREYRQATRFLRPAADATLALQQLAAGAVAPDYALQAARADLLDAYQARLAAALQDVTAADVQGFSARRAEAAALAQGYFAILAPAYAEQRGAAAAEAAAEQFSQLVTTAVAGEPVSPALQAVEGTLDGFRAAPLSPAQQARRGAQLLRFLALVPVEYGRGVRGSQVTSDLELREAIAFAEAARGAFGDLQPDLTALDAEAAAQASQALADLEQTLTTVAAQGVAVDAGNLQAAVDALLADLQALMPAAWQQHDSAADFDVIGATLDQMQAAVAAGDYARAESARLEAYAILESGPEARLVAFAPQTIAPIEGLFWYGEGDYAGLAALLERSAPLAAVTANRQALDTQLADAAAALSGQASPTAMALNAAILVFREGLEAVVILAALTASMIGARRIYRKPMALGVFLAFLASGLTWWLMQTVLFAFRGYGEKLEAVVSLLAIGVLLLITNWFFHRVYWTDWMAELHSRKKTLMGGALAGQMLGFLTLGFTSVYREGFETVLFLQALVLDAGIWPVLQGTALGLAAVFTAGWLTFKLQSRLPYKRMLVWTGVLIGAVLLVMVGNTAHVMQLVGWLPVHPLRWLTLPYWVGMWFGTYATWEGLLLQGAAALFVIGSYLAAEALSKRKPSPAAASAAHPHVRESDASAPALTLAQTSLGEPGA